MDTIKRNDALLMELMNEKQSIVGFFDAIFGFLSRWTDFYLESENPTDGIGYPIGGNSNIVQQIFKKWQNQSVNDQNLVVENEVEVATEVCEEIVTEEVVEADEELAQDANDLASNSVQICKKKKCAIFSPADYYNGAMFENYCWSQTINEIEIHISLPDHIISSKQLIVQIDSTLEIIEKETGLSLFTGELFAKCKTSTAMWSLANGKLQISLDKSSEIWWKQLLVNEENLDLKQMDCSRPLEDLSEDAQAAVSKLQWDEHQKILGNPTSEEIQQKEMLLKAWNVEGSPFKDTTFDPDSIKFG